MSHQPPWAPAHPPFEYPDIAGYPDGVGTLDQGTARTFGADAFIVAELEMFMTGDSRSS